MVKLNQSIGQFCRATWLTPVSGRSGSRRYAVTKTVAPRGFRFTRDRLLEAAQELFAEHGVSGTSLQMIADRLGVNEELHRMLLDCSRRLFAA